jgi:hypothetical protein
MALPPHALTASAQGNSAETTLRSGRKRVSGSMVTTQYHVKGWERVPRCTSIA